MRTIYCAKNQRSLFVYLWLLVVKLFEITRSIVAEDLHANYPDGASRSDNQIPNGHFCHLVMQRKYGELQFAAMRAFMHDPLPGSKSKEGPTTARLLIGESKRLYEGELDLIKNSLRRPPKFVFDDNANFDHRGEPSQWEWIDAMYQEVGIDAEGKRALSDFLDHHRKQSLRIWLNRLILVEPYREKTWPVVRVNILEQQYKSHTMTLLRYTVVSNIAKWRFAEMNLNHRDIYVAKHHIVWNDHPHFDEIIGFAFIRDIRVTPNLIGMVTVERMVEKFAMNKSIDENSRTPNETQTAIKLKLRHFIENGISSYLESIRSGEIGRLFERQDKPYYRIELLNDLGNKIVLREAKLPVLAHLQLFRNEIPFGFLLGRRLYLFDVETGLVHIILVPKADFKTNKQGESDNLIYRRKTYGEFFGCPESPMVGIEIFTDFSKPKKKNWLDSINTLDIVISLIVFAFAVIFCSGIMWLRGVNAVRQNDAQLENLSEKIRSRSRLESKYSPRYLLRGGRVYTTTSSSGKRSKKSPRVINTTSLSGSLKHETIRQNKFNSNYEDDEESKKRSSSSPSHQLDKKTSIKKFRKKKSRITPKKTQSLVSDKKRVSPQSPVNEIKIINYNDNDLISMGKQPKIDSTISLAQCFAKQV